MFDNENYYELLNLPMEYDIDLEVLESHYLRLYSAISENRSKLAQNPEFFDNYLSMLNEAKKCLSDDISRAEHYLALNNRVPTPDQSESFLRIIFDLRSIADPEERAKKLSEELAGHKAKMTQALRDGNLDEAAKSLSRLKFLVKNYE